MLRDAAGFTGDNVCFADIVEQRSLTVVNVTHYGNDWSAWFEVLFIILFLLNGILHFGTHKFGLKAKFVGNNVNGFCVQALVDADHHADTHTRTNDFCHRHIHHRRQFVCRNKFR